VAQWNQTDKTLQTKIVYWGPALCGKTTNLQQIHAFTDPAGENRLISLNTASDRTLFFDLLPLDLGKIFGHTLKIQVYTVPGQVRYDATRRIVLSGADTVVFVADSQRGRGAENRAAWENLRTNLKAIGLDPLAVPAIVQYNKQDLAACLTPREVEATLQSGREGIAASAIQGLGVLETFQSAVLEMLKRLATISGRRRADDMESLENQVGRVFERYARSAAALAGAPIASAITEVPVSDDDLGGEANGLSRDFEPEGPDVPDGRAEGTEGPAPITLPPAPASVRRLPLTPANPATIAGGAPAAPSTTAEPAAMKPASAASATTARPAPAPSHSAPAQPMLPVPPASSSSTLTFPDDTAGEDLLVRSLRATLGLAEQFGEMREIKNRLARRIGELESLQALARDLSMRRDTDSILGGLVDAALSIPSARAASILFRPAPGEPLRLEVARGLENDPLADSGIGGGSAEEILDRGEAVLLETLPVSGGSFLIDTGPLCSALVVPLHPALRPAGLLIAYAEEIFAADDLRFLGLIASHAAVCLDNAVMTESLTRVNDRLENEVRARTGDLEQANEDLRELDRMKDRFLSSVSHEMKTPLTGILSGTELLLSLKGDEDDSREFLTMVKVEAQRLSALVDRILRFQVLRRRASDGVPAKVESFDLVSRAVMEVIDKAAVADVEIAVDLPQGMPLIEVEREAVALALREVLDNAVKFSQRGGLVQVEAREKLVRKSSSANDEGSRFLVVSVRDRGPGIAMLDQTRIFEQFEQLGDLLTGKPEGLGLGLSIAREIARRHGGDLRVNSEPGAGSDFRIYIPVAERLASSDVRAGTLETAP